MYIIGAILVVIGIGWISYRIYLAYNSAGGTVIVTLYDAAFFPPPMIAAGLYLALPALGVNWSIWIYLAIWIGTAALVVGGIKLAEEIGDRGP